MPKHVHYHFVCGAQIGVQLGEIMATVQELSEKVDAILVNNGEMATEVGRIGGLIQEIRDQLANNPTAEELAALGAKLDGAVAAQQAVEDSLRTTS